MNRATQSNAEVDADVDADVDAEASADEASGLDAPWLLIGLTGGGAVLAASLYRETKDSVDVRSCASAVVRGALSQYSGPELAPVEKTINATGAAATRRPSEFMDEALRQTRGTARSAVGRADAGRRGRRAQRSQPGAPPELTPMTLDSAVGGHRRQDALAVPPRCRLPRRRPHRRRPHRPRSRRPRSRDRGVGRPARPLPVARHHRQQRRW